MTTKIKLYIGRKVLDSLNKASRCLTATQLKSMMVVEAAKPDDTALEVSIPLGVIENKFGENNIHDIFKIKPDEIIQTIRSTRDRSNRRICFGINRNIFIKEIVEQCIVPDINGQRKRVVVEFSSPNVAKPFHVGHLRSTIIGNFVANINDFFTNDVVKINYLGDWGTQFGLIKVGINELKLNEDDIKENPLKVLFDSYVHANKLSEKDPEILVKAKKEFSKLEDGSKVDIEHWRTYLAYTIDELKTLYARLGVQFDEYNYESMYSAKEINEVICDMTKKKILKKLPDGKQVARVNDRNVSVIKSDGSTLYLSRDIAAAIDRYNKYKFDTMYYIVDNSQNDHFNTLKGILCQMDLPWVHRMQHVKFGRIKGMSTRKGNVIFLKDILDESKELMFQRQMKSPTTKVSLGDTTTSDILGISCVIINDLKQRRQKDYEFSWDKALQVQGDTGVKLQYTHCRLCSLEKNSGAIPARECIPELFSEPEVIALVRELAKFHDILHRAEDQLEACIVVTYLFRLCNHISKALKTIKIKDQDSVLASQRLLLFRNAKTVLHQGMTILGLQPLTEM